MNLILGGFLLSAIAVSISLKLDYKMSTLDKNSPSYISQNINSLSQSGCTPHLLYSRTTIHKFHKFSSYQSPLQITYMATLCVAEQNDETKTRHCLTKLNNRQSKFIKPFPHRFGTICHAFLFLWSYPSDWHSTVFVYANYLRLDFSTE